MNLEKFSLKGKRALVTGAAGLLGIEHCAALAESGAHVILTDISDSGLDEAIKILSEEYGEENFSKFNMDVTDDSSISLIFEECKKNGGVDILVNNAAIDPKVTADNLVMEMSRYENFPLEQWDFQISVGLTGAFLCCKHFGRAMAEKGGWVILNISSDLSVIAPDQRLYKKENLSDDLQPVKPVTYSVIKTALIGLTRYLASYWADKGVRINALSPGGVFNGQGDDFVANLSNLIPMGRMATRDEYRGVIQFLCSDASSYMTGQNVVVDGGRSIL